MAMGFATDDPRLRQTPASVLAERYAAAGAFPTRYWTPELQVGAFALPRFIADLVETA
jgi:spermidine synthase